MARDHHQTGADRRHAGSSSGGGKRHRTTTTALLPPVPAAHPGLLQAAPQQSSSSSDSTAFSAAPQIIPAADPETLPATRGLNEWGAFTRGGTQASGSFNPLIFRNNAPDTPPPQEQPRQQQLTGRDLVEMDRLMRNDPVSFNPLQAISWARLDDEEEVVTVDSEVKGKGKAKGKTPRHDGSQSCATQKSLADEYAVSSTREYRHEHSGHRHHHQQQQQQQQTRCNPSPVGNMAHTFSHMEMTHGNAYIPPTTTAASPSSMPPPQATQPSPPGSGRQQRKHRHRHEKKSGASPTTTDMYQQGYAPASFPPTTAPQQHPYPPSQMQQFQVAYTTYNPSSSTSTSHHPYPASQSQHPHPETNLLLCLAPSCQARFASEAQLQSHYQAIHIPTTTTTQHAASSYSPAAVGLGSDTTLSHACSWSACNAAGFTSNNALVWHVKAEHLLLCPVPGCCERVFASRKQLEGHVRNKVV